ncbi:hypothetical protein [Nannocystis sp. SCPEA4]|uniref:hypothetical protein n=1 Tax=Nannocystis sp. SCPEA4 TaxID=2996787 RepID=UPI00226F66D7|nr:hypothetical protein [Nannocystis sp. SCPEA4]MCY1054844.1 hypothetical protein [Nannocystis sp. SCPEA4]
MSDSSFSQVQAAIAALHAGDRPGARARLTELWHELADDGAARCVIAHYLADAHDDPREVLRWDERALAAADALSDDDLQRLHPSLSLRAFYPSLYLNLAEALRVLGDPRARVVAAQATAAAEALPEDDYGHFIRAAIRRLVARIG